MQLISGAGQPNVLRLAGQFARRCARPATGRPSAFDRSETDVRLLATGRCLCSMIVLFNLCRSRTANSIWSRTMRLISSLMYLLRALRLRYGLRFAAL